MKNKSTVKRKAVSYEVDNLTIKSYSNYKSDRINSLRFDNQEEIKINCFMRFQNSIAFQNISPECVKEIIHVMSKRKCSAGEEIVTEGATDSEMFIIAQGTFKVVKASLPNEEVILGCGEIFGEISLLFSTPRNATVTAEREGLLFCITRS